MLNIHVATQNEFYKLGVIELIKTIASYSGIHGDISFIDNRDANENTNIIIINNAIIVNIFDTEHLKKGETRTMAPRARVFLPFNVRNMLTSEIVIKLHKIIKIAKVNYKKNLASKIFKETGLHKHMCITEIEGNVIRLTGVGHPLDQLKLSRCRTAAHRRNATRKLGMINRIQLYQFSSALREYYINENIFIYL